LSCELEWINELYSPFIPITAAIGSPEDYLNLVDENEEYCKNNSFICITGLHPDLVNAVILDSSDNNTKTMKAGIMGWKENGSILIISMWDDLSLSHQVSGTPFLLCH
jgi:hypothetical protein